MDSRQSTRPTHPLATLRRFIRPPTPVERCELCGAEVAAEHQHLIEPAIRKLVCACQPCAILFSGQAEMKYKRVPRRIRFLPDFRLTDAQWDGLMVPINMAFFFNSVPAGKVVALYPGPAGPTESLLSLESWEEIVADNPLLKEMEPDVEALLVNRLRRAGREETGAEYYLAPIDKCYELSGLIRLHWRGLSGGNEVWEEIARFFAGLKERATIIKKDDREAARA
ncbi:MAG: DUF5947 family protein [Acidobacteriota bacterium]|nr:DUF5947 family protein [Acidobacteriota bacterium]